MLDESILKTFELNDPRLDELSDDVDAIYSKLRQHLPPEKAPQSLLEEIARSVFPLVEQTQEMLPLIKQELEQWKSNMESDAKNEFLDSDSRLDLMQQKKLFERIETSLAELELELEADARDAIKIENEIATVDEIENWRRLQSLIGGRVQNRITTLFVLQNQIRLFLIKLQPFDIDIDFAVGNCGHQSTGFEKPASSGD